VEPLFRGWPEQAYTVLLQLGGEPSLETRERVRRDREAQVRQPMIDLLSDLADMDSWYEDFAVWHYASTAFWWQNQCAIVRVARNRSLIAAREIESEAIHDVQPVYHACERLRPLLTWLAQHAAAAPEATQATTGTQAPSDS
jgi:hypothetical protein